MLPRKALERILGAFHPDCGSVGTEMSHVQQFFEEARNICETVSYSTIEAMADQLAALKARNGRLFLIGVGGSAGNCSHAVNDFRKLCGIQAYSPVDNVSELTARANDEGWDTIFSGWLDVSNLSPDDAILIFSVGGGDIERNVRVNLVRAVDAAKKHSAGVFGIVGKDTGYT